jgi:hypothetical protein
MNRRIVGLLSLCVLGGASLLALQPSQARADSPCNDNEYFISPSNQCQLKAAPFTLRSAPGSGTVGSGTGAGTGTGGGTGSTSTTPACSKQGVLINLATIQPADYGLTTSTACIETVPFRTYLRIFLDQNFPLIILVAVVMVIVAGLQYMLSGFSAGEAGKAKQRIGGIIAGIVFYMLIRLILDLLQPGLSLSGSLPQDTHFATAVTDSRG